MVEGPGQFKALLFYFEGGCVLGLLTTLLFSILSDVVSCDYK